MENSKPLKINDLWLAGQKSLSLELAVDNGLEKNVLTELSLNRSGLGLTGFFQYFPNKRLQIFGLSEMTFLKSLPAEDLHARLEQFCSKHVPGIVLTRGRKVPEVLKELCQKYETPVFRTSLVTSDFINKCTLLIENLTAPQKRIQGTMMEINGLGVLLRGESGIGKSEAALTLISRGHSLVSDDVTEVRLNSIDGKLIGSANELIRYHLEIRGLGIIHVSSLYGVAAIRGEKSLDLIIELKAQGDGQGFERVGAPYKMMNILGVNVPQLIVPVSAGKDVASVIEAASLNFKLQCLGHDAAKELDEKLVSILQKRGFGGFNG